MFGHNHASQSLSLRVNTNALQYKYLASSVSVSYTFQSVLGNVWFIGGLRTWGQIDLMPLWNINRVGCFQCGEGGLAWGEIAFAFQSIRFYNQIKLCCLCIILCGRNPIFDRFHPLWGTCNLRPVFRVFDCTDVSVGWQVQLLCECVCVCEHWTIPYSISIYGAALMLFAGLWLLELWAGGLSLLSPQELARVCGLLESKHGLFILTYLCIRPGEKTWKQKES